MRFFHKKKDDEPPIITHDANMDFDKSHVMKALTALAIDRVLIEIGRPILDKVTNELQRKYKCYIPDCYDHPEYLANILKSVFGDSYRTVVMSITNELQEYTHDQGIEILIKTIGR